MSFYQDKKDSSFLSPVIKSEGNHMILSNVQKPSKVKFVNIDTRFQEEYGKNEFFHFHFPQPIREVKSIFLTHIEIPFSFYNFSSQKGNDSFMITKDSTKKQYPIQIPTQNYGNVDLLKSSLNSSLQSFSDLSGKIQFQYDTNQKLNIYVSGGTYLFEWNVSTSKIKIGSNVTDYDKNLVKSRLGWALGFRDVSFNVSSTKTADTVTDLNTTRYLFLVVDEYAQSNPNSFVTPLYNSFINKNVLARLQIDPYLHKYSTIITANPLNIQSDKRTYLNPTDIQKLKIQLVDEWGNSVDLNHFDFSFCLKIEYE